jgi:antitoxin MazE
MYIQAASRESAYHAGAGRAVGQQSREQIAQRVGLCEGARVEIEADADRIVITQPRRRYQLAELLQGMTPEAMREAFDWGPDRGREIVE